MDIEDVNNLNGAAKFTLSTSGVMTGGLLGYNRQPGSAVFCFESDIGWLWLGDIIFMGTFPAEPSAAWIAALMPL